MKKRQSKRNKNMFKKSLYIYLTGLLGVLLFLILHRIAAFAYLLLLYTDYAHFSFGLSFFDITVLDYFTLILVMLLGGWYGVWLGVYWYEAVYEGTHGGFFGHVIRHYWPNRKKVYGLSNKISAAADKLEHEAWELDDVAKKVDQIATADVMPKKRVVRRKKQ